jgi:hypothetical protein
MKRVFAYRISLQHRRSPLVWLLLHELDHDHVPSRALYINGAVEWLEGTYVCLDFDV